MNKTEKVERLVVTVEEAAQILGICRTTAYTLARTGKLGAIRISTRRFIIPRKAIDNLLEASRIKG